METYINQQNVLYGLDSPNFSKQFVVENFESITPLERKKIILHCYYLLRLSQKKPSSIHKIGSDKIETHYGEILTWQQLKELYTEEVKTVPFIGYGSLINKESFQRTLPGERNFNHALIFGTKRMFTYKFPFEEAILRLMKNPHEIAALGLDPTYNPAHFFNGVVFDLKKEEIDPLAKREPGYQIMRLPYVDDSADGSEIKMAYGLIYPQNDGLELRPYVKYVMLIVGGFENDLDRIGLFFKTTYLADGTTTLAQWIEREARRYCGLFD